MKIRSSLSYHHRIRQAMHDIISPEYGTYRLCRSTISLMHHNLTASLPGSGGATQPPDPLLFLMP